ncbi:MAG: lysophospholipid acyltransferase family protein [Bacteroidota bacterium]
MGYLLAFVRFILLFLISTITVLSILLFSGFQIPRAMRIRRLWAKSLFFFLNIKLVRRGNLPEGPGLLVGNHRSYIDPIGVLNEVLACPVAKAEVEKWPVIGVGAKLSGIIYVKREDKTDRKNALSSLVEAIQEGQQVMIYPEGTTAGEPTTLPFRYGGFAMALQHGFTVIPMAVEYRNPGMYWVGKDTFLPHFFRTFKSWQNQIFIHYGTPLSGDTPEEMAQHAMNWINETIAGFRAEWTETQIP